MKGVQARAESRREISKNGSWPRTKCHIIFPRTLRRAISYHRGHSPVVDFDPSISLRIRSPKFRGVDSGPLCKGFRTSDPRKMWWVKVASEMSSLVSMLFWTFLNPLKFLMEIFNILVCLLFR